MAEPQKQQMGDANIQSMFGDKRGVLVKQTMRGCLQECLGCEAKSEFKVAPMEWKYLDGYKVTSEALEQPETMYALEESSCLCRLCWRDGRAMNMEVSAGSEPGGQGVVNFTKPLGCPLQFTIPTGNGDITCPCCCYLPKVDTVGPDGNPLGSTSQYICDINLCVPKLKYIENGADVYIVKPETCCGGCCIACSCGGKGCTYLPFYFHDPETMQPIGGTYDGAETPQIRKVWAGLKKECCSTADTFAVMFPEGITPERKAGLLGMTFLIDFTVFERQQEQ